MLQGEDKYMCESQTSAVPPLNQMHMLHNEAHFVKVIRCLQVNYFKISQEMCLGATAIVSIPAKESSSLLLKTWITLFRSLQLVKWKWSDIWPSMVTHTRNLCSELNPSKFTHTVVNTLPEHWAVICCGARGSVGGLVTYSMVSPQSDLRLELATFRLQVQLSNH